MKLTESMLRKIIREEIDDTLDYIPPTGQTKGKGFDSADPYLTKKYRPTFRETLQLREQNGKPIMLKADLRVTERVYARPPGGGEYSLEGEPYEKVGYVRGNIIPTTGQLFKVVKVVTYGPNPSLKDLMADPEVQGSRAEIANPSYQRRRDSSDTQNVIIQNDKFGVFTVQLLPEDIRLPR